MLAIFSAQYVPHLFYWEGSCMFVCLFVYSLMLQLHHRMGAYFLMTVQGMVLLLQKHKPFYVSRQHATRMHLGASQKFLPVHVFLREEKSLVTATVAEDLSTHPADCKTVTREMPRKHWAIIQT
jgi:hypothetical protein